MDDKNKTPDIGPISPQRRGVFAKIKKFFVGGKVDYFDIFIVGMSICQDAIDSLQEALENDKIGRKELGRIKEIKHAGTMHVHDSLKLVEDAFITPIDQRDIIEIIKEIEVVLHSIESVANHFYIMRVHKSDDAMKEMVQIEADLCQKLSELMVAFKHFSSGRDDKIRFLINEIFLLEHEGDLTYSSSMLKLFKEEEDPIILIKKKEMYQRLEYSTDCFLEVADLVNHLIAVAL